MDRWRIAYLYQVSERFLFHEEKVRFFTPKNVLTKEGENYGAQKIFHHRGLLRRKS